MHHLVVGILGPALGFVLAWALVALARHDQSSASKASLRLHAAGAGLIGCAALRFVAGPAILFSWLFAIGITLLLAGVIASGWNVWTSVRRGVHR